MTVIYKQDLHYLAQVWCGTQYAETCSNCPLDGCGGDCTDPCKDKWPITKCEKNKEKGWCIPPKGKRTRNNCKRTCGICEPDCVDKWKYKILWNDIPQNVILWKWFWNTYNKHTNTVLYIYQNSILQKHVLKKPQSLSAQNSFCRMK